MIKWLLALGLMVSSVVNAETKILAFAGSTSATSVNKKLIQEAAKIAREMGAQVTVISLNDYPIPFYNAQEEKTQGMPAKAKELRRLMIQSDAIMIASPEYNASLTAVLKNALDWASRSENASPSRDAFKGKKFAIMSASPGTGGGARGLVHLRAILEAIGGTVVSGQVIIPNAYQAFNEQGNLKSEQSLQELKQLISQLLQP